MNKTKIKQHTITNANNKFPVSTKIKIIEPVLLSIANIADEMGIECFVVGGYVRDYFLNRKKEDYDITVVGDAINFANEIAKKFASNAVIYESFRTALVPIHGYKIEFVGTRKESYEPDSRKPIVTEGTLYDDIKRRDFTINTLAASLNKNSFGEIIDLFHGLDDIEKKIIRTPLEPQVTFSDDPLRMMRAIRFASQLYFSIDEKCLEAIKNLSNRIEIISKERISDEFLKILASDNPSLGINLLYSSGLLKFIFPELNDLAGVEIVLEGDREYAHKDVLRHTLKVLDNISTVTDNVWLRFAALVHDIAKPKTKKYIEGIGWSFHGHEEIGARWMNRIFRRMKFPLEHLEYIQKLVRLHQRPMALVDEEITDSAVRRLAFQAGEALHDLFVLCRADITTKNPNLSQKYLNNYEKVAHKVEEVQVKDKLREFQSPVRGDEIMQICNIQPSRTVGKIKSLIEEAILDGIIPNEYEAAKKYFLENKDKWLKELKP